MTTTIDSHGRATGDTTATRITDLRPGDVIEASWEELAEVRLVEPITGTTHALLVFVGGHVETVPADARYGVVDPGRAEKFRAYQQEMLRRRRLADQLDDLVKQIRLGDLPMPDQFSGAHLGVDVDSEADVDQAAKALGVEVERGQHVTAAYRPGGDGDLSVRFMHHHRAVADA